MGVSYGVVKTQHFESTLLGGREGVTKKEYSAVYMLLKLYFRQYPAIHTNYS